MMWILRKIRSLVWFIHALFWCLFHGVKYRKGTYIGLNVKKKHRVKLILGQYCRISYNTLLWGDGKIVLGNHSSIGSNSRIFASKDGGVEIGEYVNCASHLYIIDADHGIEPNMPLHGQKMVQKKVTIGNDIWIAYHVTILKGVVIGDGAVCGACCLVTKDVPSNAIVGGVPAKIIRYR